MYEDLLLPPKSLHVAADVGYPDEVDENQSSKELTNIMKELVYDNLNQEITFKPMVGGVTNTLFKSSFKNDKGNHKNVIIRLYGKGSENLIDRKVESHIQYLLSQNGVGPKFYGTFNNGCIYGYIEGDQLQLEDLASSRILKLIANEVKSWHSLELDDLSGGTPSSFKYLESWIQQSKLVTSLDGINLEYYINESMKLIEFLKDKYQDSKFIKFCHNDLIPRNMIYNRAIGDEGKVKFIDFEYSGYNYRGYDIGNFFCEFSGLDLDYSRFPSVQSQKEFIRYYLTFNPNSNATSNDTPVHEDDVHQLYVEANHFTLVSHLMWGFWGIVQSQHSAIDFDYIDYAKKRFKQFDLVKNKVLSLK